MNLYKVKPQAVSDGGYTHWHMPSFYIVAPDFTSASLLAQIAGIKHMNEANMKIEEHNVKVASGEAEAPFAWMGVAAREMPVMPAFKVESIKLVQENIAVEGE